MIACMISIVTDTRRQGAFIPADPALVRTLGSEEERYFSRNGIFGPFTVHTLEEVQDNRVAFDVMLAAFRAQGKDPYAINGEDGS